MRQILSIRGGFAWDAARHRSYRSVARVAWCDSDATMRQEGAVADVPLGTFNVARGVFSHPVFAREPFTERVSLGLRDP
jgi:hypothetical protein